MNVLSRMVLFDITIVLRFTKRLIVIILALSLLMNNVCGDFIDIIPEKKCEGMTIKEQIKRRIFILTYFILLLWKMGY